jgi:hypothetical protein
MNRKFIQTIAFIFFLCSQIFIIGIFFSCNKINLEVPPIEGAYGIEKYQLGKGVFGVRYKVKAPYRSLKVLDYYDEKLKEKGFLPFVESYYSNEDRKWTNIGEEILSAYWVDIKKTKRILLVVKASLKGKTFILPEHDIEQEVIYQENPYFELPPPF